MQSKSILNYVSSALVLQAVLQVSLQTAVEMTNLFGLDAGQTSHIGAYALGRDGHANAQASLPAGRKPSQTAIAAANESKPEQSKPEPPKRDLSAPVLTNLAKEYKESPDDVTWGKYFTYLRDLLVNPDFAQANPADLIAANPTLADLHVKVIDAGVKNMHLWSFPSVAENHGVIFAAPGKTTAIPLPLSIVLREGRIIPSSYAAPASAGGNAKSRVLVKVKGKKGMTVVRSVRSGRSALSPASRQADGGAVNPSVAAYGKYLVLIGGDRQTNALWLKGFKLGEGPLMESPELFGSLPMFFSQNVSGKAAFSGSDIVLTIQPPSGPVAAKDADDKPEVVIQANGKPLPVKSTNMASAGYKVMLKYMGGKFALAGHLPDDAPLSIALAFAQNICAGRSDVAKAWLVDPKLVSIPKYLGLIGRNTPPMRLVAMSGASGARYRLVTSAKDDLIIDVGRITAAGRLKGQLAIKGLFIAPPDPYAAKLTGTLVLPQAADKASVDGEDSANTGTSPATSAATKQNGKSATKPATKSGATNGAKNAKSVSHPAR